MVAAMVVTNGCSNCGCWIYIYNEDCLSVILRGDISK